MAEWTGRKRTLNSIPAEEDSSVDATSDHVPRSPEAPGAIVSPQRPGATPDIADLPGRTRGDFDRLLSTRRPLTEYGSAQRLLGLYTPAPGQELTAADWEQGPAAVQELRKLNPANLTPRRPLSGYGLGLGRTTPALAAPEAEADSVGAAETGNPETPVTPQLEPSAAASTTPTEAPSAPAGAIHGGGQVDCPPEYPVKGNAQSKIYHTPQSRVYAQTIAEYCFASADSAEAAGFRPPHN